MNANICLFYIISPLATSILGLSAKVQPEISRFLTLCYDMLLSLGNYVSQRFTHLSFIPTTALQEKSIMWVHLEVTIQSPSITVQPFHAYSFTLRVNLALEVRIKCWSCDARTVNS